MKIDKALIVSLLLLTTLCVQANNAKANPTKHEFHHPQQTLQRIAASRHSGKKIYQSYCANCHAEDPTIPLGAPRVGHQADWQPRLKQGMNKLFEHTSLGLNNMPARGGCFECSDKLLRAAIQYMLPQEKSH